MNNNANNNNNGCLPCGHVVFRCSKQQPAVRGLRQRLQLSTEPSSQNIYRCPFRITNVAAIERTDESRVDQQRQQLIMLGRELTPVECARRVVRRRQRIGHRTTKCRIETTRSHNSWCHYHGQHQTESSEHRHVVGWVDERNAGDVLQQIVDVVWTPTDNNNIIISDMSTSECLPSYGNSTSLQNYMYSFTAQTST